MTKEANKVVLAYSGGLDTSVAIQWLKNTYNCKVVAMIGDVGQQEDLEFIRKKAEATGADKVYVEELQDEFARHYLVPMLKANALYERKYLLGSAVSRPLLGKALVNVAAKERADAVAHGCTGKGNDQVRFELAVKALAPHLKIIAPWREWEIQSREDAMSYAHKSGIEISTTKKKPYSIDRNLWHSSYEGGVLEDPLVEPEEEMFLMTCSPEQARSEPEYIQLGFQDGTPTHLNGERLSSLELIKHLNTIAGRHGIGRTDMIEDRLLGMKSRGVYETPGGTVLIRAKQEIEEITLDKDTIQFNEMIASKYAELVYNGLWFSRLKEGLDAYVNHIQKYVTGEVKLKLYKGNTMTAGKRSPYTLYREDLATFEEDEVYNHKDAEGFINLFGLSVLTQGKVNREYEMGEHNE